MTLTKHFRLITAQPNVTVTSSDDGTFISYQYTTKSGFCCNDEGLEALERLQYMNPMLYEKVVKWLDDLRQNGRPSK